MGLQVSFVDRLFALWPLFGGLEVPVQCPSGADPFACYTVEPLIKDPLRFLPKAAISIV
jgi:hypothetical protein